MPAISVNTVCVCVCMCLLVGVFKVLVSVTAYWSAAEVFEHSGTCQEIQLD